MAVIVVAIFVGVTLLAALVHGSVQDSRIAYVTVRTDKDVYTSDENVTFKLVPLTKGLQFALSGGMNSWNNGVHVVRIPDDVGPDDVVTDPSLLREFGAWGRGRIVLPLETFSSDDGPLEMSWNGTIAIGGEMAGGAQYAQATSGYYMLYPQLERYQGHVTKFMLDEAAVFYYESLNVDISAAYSPGSFSMSMNISLGEGMPEGEYKLRSRLSPLIYDEMMPVYTYLNKSMRLVAGSSMPIESGPMRAHDHALAEYDAVVTGPDGRLFAFGMVKSSGGEWYYDHRY